MDDVKKELLEKLRGELITGLEKEGLKLTDWGLNSWQAATGFNVQFGNDEQHLYLRFEFEKTSLNSFGWGISRKKKEYSNDFYASKSWPWWPWVSVCPDADFDTDMENWSISAKPWLKINDGSLASQVIELAVNVHDAFTRNKSLHLLCETEPSQ
jgi:hypothetical protein